MERRGDGIQFTKYSNSFILSFYELMCITSYIIAALYVYMQHSHF